MARGQKQVGLPQVLGGLVVLAVGIVVIKWLLITALILVVPFGVWWLYDRTRTPATAGGPPGPTVYVPAGYVPAGYVPAGYVPAGYVPSALHRQPPPTTRFAPAPDPVRARVLAADREVVVTREEDHQDVLARHHRAGGSPTPVTADLHPATVSRGTHRGAFAIEVRLDGERVGELTATMSARYRHVLHPAGYALARGRVSAGDRGLQLDLRLPAVT